MVETITPVVHGGRNRKYWSSVALHTAGATISASLLGAVLGGFAGLLGAPWNPGGYFAIGIVAAIYLARETLGLPVPLPHLRRQVPQWWRSFYGPRVAAFLYGIGLGLAFMTYLTFGTFAVVAVGAFVSGSSGGGALIVGAFGLARGLSVVVAARQTTDDEDPDASVTDSLEELKATERPRRLNAAVIGAILLVAATAAGVAVM